jgi:hypothetical protein
MDAPVNVGMVVFVIIGNGLHDLSRTLRRRGIVQVGKRPVVDHLPEDRKIVAKRFEIGHVCHR